MDVALGQWVPVGLCWFQSSGGAEMQNQACGSVSLARPC